MHRTSLLLAAVVVSLPFTFACEAAPRARPVKAGPVDTGADSLEAVRRQLKGTWNLAALEVVSGTGEKTAVQASGRLEYDEYGNLSMQGTVTGSASVDGSVLNLTGRAAVDPVTRTIRMLDVQAPTPDERRLDPQLDAKLVRHYEFSGDLLKLTVKTATGAISAVATWRKIQ